MANPEHLSRLDQGVEAWNEWRASRDLEEVDLRGVDLTDRDLRGVDFWYARLQGARLRCADLAEAILVRADLTLADMTHATLWGADLKGAILDQAVLRATAFVDADLTLAKVTRAKLDGTIFTGSSLAGANFHGSDRTRAYGLKERGGWIDDEGQAPSAEVGAIDLRDAIFGALRKHGGG